MIDGKAYTYVSPYSGIDESKLSIAERLGLAYCRLNSGEWDELLGAPSTDEIAIRKMEAIKEIIGDANTSKAWWTFNLKRTEEEWRAWYYRPQQPYSARREKIKHARHSGSSEKRCRNKLKDLPNLFRSFFSEKRC